MIPIRENGCYCYTLETTDTVDIFTKPMYKQIIVHSLNHFINSKGLVVYGWCLMSNKLYVICHSTGVAPLEDIQNDFLSFTCEKIVDAVKGEPGSRSSWLLSHFRPVASHASPYHPASCWGTITVTAPIDMRQPQHMAEQLEFLHSIPVKDRIVQYCSDYVYSSARDYSGITGLVKINKLTLVEQELHKIESRKSGFRIHYYH